MFRGNDSLEETPAAEIRAAAPAVRSLLLECRTWLDAYAQGHTGACLWINGGFVGFFGVAYGRADDLEHYRAAPWLESVGLIPPTEESLIISAHRRIKEAVTDYYMTDMMVSRRRDAYPRHQLPTREELWALLARREWLAGRA